MPTIPLLPKVPLYLMSTTLLLSPSSLVVLLVLKLALVLILMSFTEEVTIPIVWTLMLSVRLKTLVLIKVKHRLQL